MHFFRLCLVGLIAALIVPLAGCSSGSRPRTPPRWSPVKELPRDEDYHGGPNATLLKYDANHDGTLSKDELMAGLKAEFDLEDTNHSGCLTPDQVAAINQKRIAADQSTATLLQDWNQNGCVDLREFSNAAYSLFDQLDRNSDGKISPQEFNPGAPGGRQGGAAGPGGGGQGGRGGRGGGGNRPPDGGGAPPSQ